MIRDWLVIISAMVAYIRERWDVIAQLIDIFVAVDSQADYSTDQSVSNLWVTCNPTYHHSYP
jgi:hypothetical protein